jgi:septal ring factor EnvC (AmiA/AmiB activator)
MTTRTSAPTTAARQELVTRIASAQKQADAAKKIFKLKKLGLRKAKQECKAAKRAAKKLRKALEALEAELASASAVKRVRKAAVRRPATKRPRTAPTQVLTTEVAPMPTDVVLPATPAQ